jgi:hypothetical protein
MDLQEQLVQAAIQHWPVVAAIGAAGYWLFPKMLKQTLTNGGGEIIRKIIKEENLEQSKAHTDETSRIVSQAIQQHEVVEQQKLQLAIQGFRNEITDQYRLAKRPRSRARP